MNIRCSKCRCSFDNVDDVRVHMESVHRARIDIVSRGIDGKEHVSSVDWELLNKVAPEILNVEREESKVSRPDAIIEFTDGEVRGIGRRRAQKLVGWSRWLMYSGLFVIVLAMLMPTVDALLLVGVVGVVMWIVGFMRCRQFTNNWSESFLDHWVKQERELEEAFVKAAKLMKQVEKTKAAEEKAKAAKTKTTKTVTGKDSLVKTIVAPEV